MPENIIWKPETFKSLLLLSQMELWREHCWAQTYGPWPEVTHIVPEDFIHYRDRFNMFMLYLNVWQTKAPKDCMGTQRLLGSKPLFCFSQILPSREAEKKDICWSCAAHHLSQVFFIYRSHWVSGNLLLWISTKIVSKNLFPKYV